MFSSSRRKGEVEGQSVCLAWSGGKQEGCSPSGGMEGGREEEWELLPKGMPMLLVEHGADM